MIARFLALLVCLLIATPVLAQSTGGGGGGGGSGANPTGTVGLSAVNGAATTFLRSDGAPALSQSIAPTWTAEHIFNAAGAASTPSVLYNGTLFSGGSATTTFPLVYLNNGATAVTGFNTSGTLFGINGSAACGNLIDTYTNNTSVFNVTCSGNVNVSSGTLAVNGNINGYADVTFAFNAGTGRIINGVSTHFLFHSAAPTVSGSGLGTSPSITANGSGAMDITVGSTPSAATWTITFSTAAANGYVCTGADITTNSTTVFVVKQTGAQTTQTCVMGVFSDVAALAAPVASDHIRVMAIAY